MKNKNLISADELSLKEINLILDTAKFMKNDNEPILKGKIMAALFFEPSTRTRLSFESAMLRLGGNVLGFSDPKVSSFTKGETLWDTIKMVHSYADIIVIRHFMDGAARLATEASNIPIINAGDGANQHPTQTLLDLFTIKESQGKLTNLNIGMCGDLKYGRTVHSLAKILTKFNPRIYFISPKDLKIPGYIRHELKEKKIEFSEHESISEVLPKLDVLYATRIQKERFPDAAEYEKVKNAYVIEKAMLKDVKDNLKILHPLPRVNEIKKDVDDTKYAYYFEQAANALPVRKAILRLILK